MRHTALTPLFPDTVCQLILPHIQYCALTLVALKYSIFLRTLMLEFKLFSNNYCKHSKTVIEIKIAKVKAKWFIVS